MIYQSLHCLSEELNDFLKVKLKLAEDKVMLSSIVNQDGSVAIGGENKVVLTLINIEKETAKNNPQSSASSKTSANPSAAVNLNLQIMFSAYFSGSNYSEGLKFLSFVISFLQKKPVFNRSNTPRLPAGIEKLSFDMETVGVERLNNIWAMLGAKYMPSVLYKTRMLTFDDAVTTEYRPLVSTAAGNSQPISN